MEHVIDAKGRSIGRVATEAAVLLMGKNAPNVRRNVVVSAKVRVINTKELRVEEKKMRQKTYHRHSGYPGGDTKPTLRQVIDKKGRREALRIAISGMLPKNTLRTKRLMNLMIEE